jgi:hypothetical protein
MRVSGTVQLVRRMAVDGGIDSEHGLIEPEYLATPKAHHEQGCSPHVAMISRLRSRRLGPSCSFRTAFGSTMPFATWTLT